MAANRQLEEKDFEKFLKGVPTSTDGGIKGDIDVFNGVTIGPEHLVDMTYERLKKQLPLALKTWLEEGKRGIWIKIPTNQSELIPIATNLGFDFHHAQPGYVLLTKWLPSMEPNKLPRYANHQIGVAGLVVNDKDELLVIQEKYLRSLRRPIWKFPGGLADPGEDLYETAIREVKEETGIDTEFVSVLCFRHMHELKWGIDDLYFICLLRPLNTNIVMDEAEISACKWMKLSEYMADPDTILQNRLIVESFIATRDHGHYCLPFSYPHFFKGKPDLVHYSIKGINSTLSSNDKPRL